MVNKDMIPEEERTYQEFVKVINTEDHYVGGWDSRSVQGPLSPGNEIVSLREIVMEVMPAGNVIEIGCWMGLSTTTIALSLKERWTDRYKLYAIDPHDSEHSMKTDSTKEYFGNTPGGWDMHEVFWRNLQKWGIADLVDFTRAKSHDVKNLKQFKDVGFLWIDGDHRAESVEMDLSRFAPLVIPNGIIALHDKNLAGVRDSIENFMEANEEYVVHEDMLESDLIYFLKKKL